MIRDRILGLANVPVTKLRGFSAGNPKTYEDEDRQHLEDSMDAHGYASPVIARKLDDGTFEIIDGHHRVELLVARDPSASIKVVVLDVESVNEGRRILLALQHQSGWDMRKLEAFVAEAMGNDIPMIDLMRDTGLTGQELDAFSTAAADFIDGTNDDTPNDSPSRAGHRTEHVPFAVPLGRDQSKKVRAALKLAKQVSGCSAHADALVEIATFYIANHKKSASKKTSKKKR